MDFENFVSVTCRWGINLVLSIMSVRKYKYSFTLTLSCHLHNYLFSMCCTFYEIVMGQSQILNTHNWCDCEWTNWPRKSSQVCWNMLATNQCHTVLCGSHNWFSSWHEPLYWRGILESVLCIHAPVYPSDIKSACRNFFLNSNIKYDLCMMHVFSKLQYHARLQTGNHCIGCKTYFALVLMKYRR